MHRVSEAMHIARCSSRSFRRGEIAARSRQTKPDVCVLFGRSHSMARVQCACRNGEECTRCIHRAEHWPRVRNESCSLPLSLPLFLPAFLVRFAIYSRRLAAITPTHFQPLRLCDQEVAKRRGAQLCIADRDASVPLQVVNETDLPLGLPMPPIGRHCRVRSLSLPRIIISGQPSQEPNGKKNREKKRRGGPFPVAVEIILQQAGDLTSNYGLIAMEELSRGL